MKQALFYKKLKEKIVQCQLCPHYCTLKDGETGKCNVRQNKKGKLYTLVYNKPCSLTTDPIEKKPLYHFLVVYLFWPCLAYLTILAVLAS
jgi:pyruvate formate lyase activating enzyme